MPQWRRNLYVLFMVQLISTAGFSLVFPFLPLYVKEVGIATGGSVEFWAGLVFSSQAATMMIAAPIWGAVADRYGRKLMLLRATLAGAVILAAMGFVQNAEQLVALRAIQGMLTGVVAAANALVAASAPREKSGESLGLLQMARWTGIALGPLIGGVIGDAFGFRESFWITGILLALAGFAVLFWVHEDFVPVPKLERQSMRSSFTTLLKAPGMAKLYSITFLNSLGFAVILPIAPLFVLTLLPNSSAIATITGLMIGLRAFSGATSAVWFGKLGDRIGHPPVMAGAALLAILFYLPQPFVTAAWQLVLLQGLSGFATGGLIPALAALMNLWAPQGNQGATFGVENSVNASARSIAPMIGAAVAVWFGQRGVFAAATVSYVAVAVIAVWVWRTERVGVRVGVAAD
ncbi:MAG: MFS transporter [Caldilineaceae bacterium]|nr:MFS transporter [Caldilineaceae bacterium]MBP8108754.1 MFS transporter [Caldilineaceae bacterium]MBP8122327.1 MFS transporter [Caldilineaceae bacterium]MBP9072685.1 MFS transporter [Caldilineaceae bacterium]